MLSPEQKRALRKALAEKFPMQQSSLYILEDAGIPAGNIKLDPAPLDNWHAIVREAAFQYKLKDLIQAALDRYPADRVLLQLLEVFEQPPTEVKSDIAPELQPLAAKLKDFIKKDDLPALLASLLKIIRAHAPAFENDLVQLSARYEDVNRSVQKDIIREEDKRVELNRIRVSLLSLVDRVLGDPAARDILRGLEEDDLAG